MRCSLGALLAALALIAPAVQAEPCVLGRMGELPVTMVGLRPTVPAKVNGSEALFLADSGAFFSVLTPTGAKELNLPLGPAPVQLVGVGGAARTEMAIVAKFTLLGMDFPKVPFLVGGSDLGPGIVGLLGQNVFHIADVEYDLANGMIRLLRSKGDCSKTSFAYWANDKHAPYSVINIEFPTHEDPHTRAEVYVNGRRLRAIFDTGAATSVLTRSAAEHAGVGPDSPGVTPGGLWHGFGNRTGHSFIAPFESFKIGDEEVQHTRLRVADISINADMLIGADFFLSHRVLVANSQRRLYFTYNGGPVFNLTATPPTPAPGNTGEASPAQAGDAVPAQAGAAAAAAAGEQLDAAGYARRGAAETSRRDYEHAIADLTRACEMAPGEASYFYERGMAYWATQQGDPALADFEQALKLKPGYVNALLARAQLRLVRKDAPELVVADLEAADRAAPAEDAARLQIGRLYIESGNPGAAIVQYTKYIDTHPSDEVNLAGAFNQRCWARALAGIELTRALDDCDRAVHRRSDNASYYDSRGLVHLRMGHYDKAIADYDAALRLNSKSAWSLYGRGIAKLDKGQTDAGRSDLTAAAALNPQIAERAAHYGVRPP